MLAIISSISGQKRSKSLSSLSSGREVPPCWLTALLMVWNNLRKSSFSAWVCWNVLKGGLTSEDFIPSKNVQV